MIGLLRKIYSKQNLIRGVAIDRLLQLSYARWLSIRKKGRLFTVFTEISSKCNLACENCYRTNNDYPSKNLNMDFNTFKKIVDSVPSGIQYLVTQGFGESANNPELKRMLRYADASKKFGTIILDSNLLLKEAAFYGSLFNHGLDRLIVSIDSFDQKLCDRLRYGTDIQKLVRNLKEILKNYPDPVHVRTTVSKVNIEDLENLLNRLVSLGIKRVEIGPISDYYNNGIALDAQDEKRVISIIKRYEKKIDLLLSKHYACFLPYTMIGFSARGNILPCCRVFDDNIKHFGNIHSGLENTYYSEEFNQLRSTFYKKMPSFCKGCPMYKKI